MRNSVTCFANTLLSFYFQDDQMVTNIEVQKMLYIAHGHYLGFKGKILIKESFEAWTYGPVIPSLYQKLKHYKHRPIEYFITDESRTPVFIDDKEEIKLFLSFVYNAYKSYRSMDLVYFTHGRDGAWAKTWAAGEKIIKNDLIMEEYKNKELSIETQEAGKIWETVARGN